MLEKIWHKIVAPEDDNQSGVTLIEITIVIVIIGLLASVIGPRVIGNVDKQKFLKPNWKLKAFRLHWKTMQLT